MPDLRQRQEPGSEPNYPRAVTIAGIIWIVNAALLGLTLVLQLLIVFGFPGGRAQAVGAGLLLGLSCLFAWAFMDLGERCVQGIAARRTRLNRSPSILFGVIFLSPSIVALVNRGSESLRRQVGSR
jgi:hypothetical protein